MSVKEPETSVNVAMAPFRHGAEVVCWCWWGEVLPPIQQGRFFWAICMSLCNLMSLGAPEDFRIVLSKVHIGEDGVPGGVGWGGAILQAQTTHQGADCYISSRAKQSS